MEITTSWMEQGIEQGIVQGKHAMLLEQLNYRFGALQAEIEAQILTLNDVQSSALAKAIFSFNNLADLTRWLERQN